LGSVAQSALLSLASGKYCNRFCAPVCEYLGSYINEFCDTFSVFGVLSCNVQVLWILTPMSFVTTTVFQVLSCNVQVLGFLDPRVLVALLLFKMQV
jgi:hypothetical protein